MMSEVLSYLIMITCILIRVSSKEVKWTVCDPPPKLGQDLTLFCKVDNCTVRETKRWHGGPDDKLLMLNSGISTDKTKYSTSIEKNGFILTILDLTVKDLNISYTCSCGLVLDNHILYIEDVYTADNLNKTTNGTNYIGTNDVGGISLYVYIAIPVILVILLIIVIVKRHWLWGRLKEKIYGTGRRNTDIEEETPMNVVEDNLKFHSKSQEFFGSNTLKDEGLKTERKQNEEQIRNLQTKYEDTTTFWKYHRSNPHEFFGSNTLKDEGLKTERKQNEEEIRNLQTKYEVLLGLKDEELRDLRTEWKQNEEKYSVTIARFETQIKKLQAKYDEGNIRVFCRVRPKIEEDGDGPMANNVVDYDRDDDGLIYVSNRTHKFEVDKVFKQGSLQKEVFDEVKALVTSCIDGYNVCIFAYGQTGSGKTFTMEGPPLDPGINTRALKELFNEASAKGDDWSFTITVSFIEIYNEIIRDLLSDNPSNKMEVKMDPAGGFHVPGLSLVDVNTMEDVNKVLNVGKQNRAIATTDMNEHSSRSHALLCVTVTGVNKTTNTKTTGKLNLVDLAGSERVSQSGAVGTRHEEAKHINMSLSSLGDVIHALSKQNFVPYRNSKLTYLLQDSLGGDSKTLMIVQVAPVEKNMAETICSLNFAQHVRTVELGQASKKIKVRRCRDCLNTSLSSQSVKCEINSLHGNAH